jgi:hypothetical protein
MEVAPAHEFKAQWLQARFLYDRCATAPLAGGLQGFNLLENGVKPLLQLALGAGFALCPAKAGVIFKGSLVKSGGLQQEFGLLVILGGHNSILIQLRPFLRKFCGPQAISRRSHQAGWIMKP